jgi:hypothetical protein
VLFPKAQLYATLFFGAVGYMDQSEPGDSRKEKGNYFIPDDFVNVLLRSELSMKRESSRFE